MFKQLNFDPSKSRGFGSPWAAPGWASVPPTGRFNGKSNLFAKAV